VQVIKEVPVETVIYQVCADMYRKRKMMRLILFARSSWLSQKEKMTLFVTANKQRTA